MLRLRDGRSLMMERLFFFVPRSLFPGELFVALFDGLRLLRLEFPEQFQQAHRLEAIELIVSQAGVIRSRCMDGNHRDVRPDLLEFTNQRFEWNILNPCVCDDTLNPRKRSENVNRFCAAVSGKDIELRGFDHEFSG